MYSVVSFGGAALAGTSAYICSTATRCDSLTQSVAVRLAHSFAFSSLTKSIRT